MQNEVFEVTRERFHLVNVNDYILQGNWPKEHRLQVYLDSTLLAHCTIENWEYSSALERFEDLDLKQGQKVTVTVTLPQNLKEYKYLRIYAVKGKERIKWFSIKTAKLTSRIGKPCFFIEEEKVNPAAGTCCIRGWATGSTPVTVYAADQEGREIAAEIQMSSRVDVAEFFKEVEIDPKCGFYIELQNVTAKTVKLVFAGRDTQVMYPVSMQQSKIIINRILSYGEKGFRYLSTHGVKALMQKSAQKLAGMKRAAVPYQKWLPRHLPDPAELEQQRRESFLHNPKFSIVVPLYKTPPKYLERLIQSVKGQTYANWELCLSDGSGEQSPLVEVLNRYQQQDERIKVIRHQQALQIAENTNAAIEAASGDYVVFCDHDDELTAHALYECVIAVNEDPAIDVIYSDEDKMSMDGNKFFQPHFKPDFNIDLLCTVNYICHLFVVRKTLIERVGMLRREFDGAQDYDFILRCVEATDRIHHVPKILYHWRSHEDSTAENPESKLYAFAAGQKAVQAHYDRIKVNAVVTKGEYLGLYRTRFILDYEPLISIIIPNKDHIDDLERCIKSIDEKSSYHNYEYIIVENNSTEEQTFTYYNELEKNNRKVKVVYWEGNFNYSKINNFGARHASGEYLLLLNNDVEIINDDCLEELLGYCTRDDVGIVGARLYYEDDTIQHAGVVIGFGGIAGHCFVQQKRSFTGYCHRIICAQNYSAVTAACMMVKRSVFEAVGGLTPELEVAFNDIDFCLKVGAYGKLVVYNPYAQLYHYESKSRGLEDTPEKVARFNREIATFEKRWPKILAAGDPYYNPNLTLDSQDFSLKKI